MRSIKDLLGLTFSRFVIVGIINTIVGTTIMFVCYNAIGLSYWISSALNYILASILSYFLNRKFTFRYKGSYRKSAVKFTINIIACYLVAYGLAKPLIGVLLDLYSTTLKDNIAMAVGAVLFVILNYFGQKLWAFKGDNINNNGKEQ